MPPDACLPSLILDETLDLPAATELARVLDGLRGRPLAVDAAKVAHLGAQSAQVLASAALTWTAEGTAFVIVDASAPFAACLRLLGMTDLFKTTEQSL